MNKKIWLLLLLPLILTAGYVFFHVIIAPHELVLILDGEYVQEKIVHYKDSEKGSYDDKLSVKGVDSCSTKTFFILPGECLLNSLRIDFNPGKYSFQIREMTFLRKHYLKASIPAVKLKDLYMANADVKWEYKDDAVHLSVDGQDPHIVPAKGTLKPECFSWKLAPERLKGVIFFLLVFYLLSGGILYAGELAALAEKCAPWRWYMAFCFIAGALLLILAPLKGTFSSGYYISYTAVLLFFLLLHWWEMILRKREEEARSLLAATGENVKKRRVLDMTFVYFRAFAILCIVLGHYLDVSYGYSKDSTWLYIYSFYCAFFSNDTVYFLFISGYLFYYLTDHFSGRWEKRRFIHLTGKFDLKGFYWKKVKNVICPYLVCSLVAALLISFTGDTSGFAGESFSWQDLPVRLLNGSMQSQYWYIPFIIVVFFFAPLLLLLSKKSFYGILFLSIIFFISFSRTKELITLSDFLFFISSFLLGVWYARDKEILFEFFRKYFWFFLAGAAICFYVIFAAVWRDVPPFPSDQVRALHKWCMIPVMLVLLEKLREKKIPFLVSVANLSFTLYFLHMIIVQKVFTPVSQKLFEIGFTSTLEICIFRTLIAFIFLYLLCWSLKVLTGRYSRMLTGG